MDRMLKYFGTSVMFAGGIILLIPMGALFGYFGGTILKLFVGGWVVDGLNILFDTNRFTVDKIPVLCSAMAVLGMYLRTSISVRKEDK